MASSILNSDDGVISGTSGLKSTGGDDGVLVFQSKGTETARINTDKQIVAAAGTASLPIYSTTGDTNTGIFFPAADQVAVATNGVERVNLGNSATVFNDGGANVDFRVEGDTDANLLFVDASADRVLISSASNTGTNTKLAVGAGLVSTNAVLVVNTDDVNTPALSLSNWDGGATSFGPRIVFDNSGRGAFEIGGADGSNNFDICRTWGTPDVRIDSSGNLLVNWTLANPGKVSILGNSSTSAMLNLVNQSSPTTSASVGFGTTQAASASAIALAIQFGDGSAVTNNSLFIRTNGNVENTNNSYGAFSDIKLKQDIVDAGSQWDDIKGLRVRKYRFKSDPNAPLQIGLVAQEVEDVSAGLVGESPDYEQVTRTREVEKTRVVTEAVMDEDGNEIEPAVTETYTEEEEYTESVALDTTTKSVKYSVLYMKAVKALQEAIERIETLEAKVSALEAK